MKLLASDWLADTGLKNFKTNFLSYEYKSCNNNKNLISFYGRFAHVTTIKVRK